jgi:hypothetical protein
MSKVAHEDYPEDGGGKLLQNVGVYIPKYTMPSSRKLKAL